MDAEQLRTCVWEEMLSADMRANYFGELVRVYSQQDKWLRLATLLFASGSAATAVSQANPLVKLAIPIIATMASLWSFLSQYATLARDAAELHGEWNKVKRKYEQLWNSLESASAEADFHQIYDSAEGLSKSGTKFPNKEGRLAYWLDQADKLARARYA
jgi:hypothetical protein